MQWPIKVLEVINEGVVRITISRRASQNELRNTFEFLEKSHELNLT